MVHLHFLSPDVHLQVYVYWFACYLSLVISGMAMSWPSPLTAWYSSKESEVPMTEHEVSWMVSISAIGAGIGSIPSGILADRFGRKAVLLATGVTSAFSWALILMTRSKWTLYVAQILGGVVVGGAPCVAPIYVSEISSPSIRGAIVGQLNTMYFVGQLVVYAVGPQLSYNHYIWVCFSMPILFFVTFICAPESPYYLMSKGKDDEAKANMEKLRGKEALNELEIARKESSEKKDLLADLTIWQALQKNSYMKHIICLQILSGVSQFNGLATLSVYAVEFLGGKWVALEMGIVFVVSSFFAAFLADPFGRRPLLITSLIGSALSTAVLAAYFIVNEKLLLYIGLFGFCFISSVGINPFIITLPSELFPTRLRAFANGLTQLTTGIFCFISLKIFVNINETLGIATNFVMYTVISLIGAVAAMLLPETAKSTISAS